MFPVIYAPNASTFTSNGLGVLIDCTECVVTEERNGIFELELIYPVGGQHADALVVDAVIKATAHYADDGQLFRIYKIEKGYDGMLHVYAQHVSYMLSMIPCRPFTAASVADAFTKIRTYMQVDNNPFSFVTDKTTVADFALTKPTNTKMVLGGMEGSILDAYHGEFEFDNFIVLLHRERGYDRGVTIRYGKNLTDFTQEEDIAETFTGIYPYYADSDGDYVELTEKIIYCENANSFPYKRVEAVDLTSEFSDLEDEYGDRRIPTESELREAAQAYMSSHEYGVPKVNIEFSFESLPQYEEYEGLTPLEQVNLCDIVNVVFPELNVTAHAKVIKTTYNTLLDKYDSLEIGSAKASLYDTVIASSQNETKKEVSEAQSNLEKAIDRATERITGAFGGYVVTVTDVEGHPTELLIMNSPDKTTATKVWRWNLNGLAYSSHGINGPYELAMTSNGEIVADFITTGTLSANIINGGAISASTINLGSGNFVVDGSTGAVTIKSGSININNGAFKVTSAGALTSTSGLIGNWSIDNTKLYKTASTTAHTFDVVDMARMSSVIHGTLDEATVLAQYPYYDLDGDGHITPFDVELAIDAILGYIPNGVISSATTQLYPSKVYGAISSVYDLSQGVGFVSGPFGVYGTGLIGKALKIIESLGGGSTSSYTSITPTAFTASYAIALQYPQYYSRSISLSGAGIMFSNFKGTTPDYTNMETIYIRPTVISTW